MDLKHLQILRDCCRDEDAFEQVKQILATTSIQQQKQTTEELQKANNLLHLYIQNNPLAVVEWDKNFQITRWSGRAREIFGWSAEEIIGRTPDDWQFIYEGDVSVVTDVMAELLSGDCSRNTVINRNYTKDGRVIYCQWFNSIVCWGDSFSIVSLVEDITERKRTEEALQQAEERYRSIFENAVEGIFQTTTHGRFLITNPTLTQILGYESPQELVATITNIERQVYVEPGRRAEFVRLMQEQGVVRGFESEVYRQDGSTIWISENAHTICDVSGQIVGYEGTVEDISFEKRVEQVRESAELLQVILDNIPQYIFWKDRNSVYLGCNKNFAEAVGIGTPENIVGKTDYDIPTYTKAEAEYFRDRDRWTMDRDRPDLHVLEAQPMTDGRKRWIDRNKIPIHDAEGNVTGVLGTFEDVTERKLAEEVLQESAAQFEKLAQREALLNQLSNQIRNSLDLDTILSTAVSAIRSFLQIDRCSFAWYNRPSSFDVVYEARDPAQPSLLGHYPIAPNGPTDRYNPLIQSMLSLTSYKIDDVATDPHLQPETRTLLNAFGIAAEFVLPIQTRSGQIGTLNCNDSEPRHWSEDEVDLLQAIASQCAIAIDQAKLYEQSLTATAAARSHAQQLEQTLHELQKTQTQLIQSEKMSSLGQLVAGVAHEVNNPVNFIYGNLIHAGEYVRELLHLVSLYQQHYPQPAPEIQVEIETIDLEFLVADLPKIMASMKLGTQRIREIVLSLRNFSRLDEAEMKPVDIHEGIDNTLLILQNQLKIKPGSSGIEVLKEYGNLPLVECYAGQLNQVFMNILSNAIDALNRNDRRSPSEIERPNTIAICTQVLNDKHVAIKIKDNGPGMTAAVQSKIFDPFFTTKPIGKGTGLGLAISYQIVVEKHSGSLECFSQPGQGTEFWIEIPIQQTC